MNCIYLNNCYKKMRNDRINELQRIITKCHLL